MVCMKDNFVNYNQLQLFNFQKWLTSNFSQSYQYIIPQKGNENTSTYQVEFVFLI